MNILHLTSGDLGGVPQMLSDALSVYTQNSSILLQFSGEAENPGSARAIHLSRENADAAMLAQLVDWSDVIHVHNFIPSFVLAVLAQTDLSQKKTVYQIHSAKYQPPIFGDLSAEMGIPFDHRLVTCQPYARQYPDFQIVPVCLEQPALSIRMFRSAKKRVRVISAQRSHPMLDVIGSEAHIEVMTLPDTSRQNALMLRRQADITLDDGPPGHSDLVKYEGLACGNAVVTTVDDLTMMMFKTAFQVHEAPPFFRATASQLTELITDRSELDQLKKHSHEYFNDVMAAPRVVRIFDDIYTEEIQDLAWTG